MRKAVIRAAANFPGDLKTALENGLRETFGSDLACEFVTDDSVIGGFVVDVDHTVYDWSVATQLKRLKKELHK